MIKNILVISALIGSSFFTSAYAQETLDDLLLKVKQGQILENVENRKREQLFLKKKKDQEKLLDQAKAELKQVEKITEKLTSDFQSNEKKLGVLEEDLHLATGNLGEMFGVVRQVAGDTLSQLESSVTSAQVEGRIEPLKKLAQSEALPKLDGLRLLWFELLREMKLSGEVTSFKREVVLTNGERAKRTISRIGLFNLVTGSKYLKYQPETQQVLELPRQPSSSWTGMIGGIQGGSAESYVEFGVDPSRGALLSMLIQAPSLMERVKQGGLVGYVILSLLFIGLILVGERFIFLHKESGKIKAQLKSKEVLDDNSLGEVMTAFKEHNQEDLETLELKLDEVILRNTPKLTRGIGTIKILSAVAPLLGLLGTVTGMIVTFQSITLFGTGDPKLMAGGISQALITTVLGLVCAIPLLLLHNVVQSRSKQLLQILEEQSAGLVIDKLNQGEGSPCS